MTSTFENPFVSYNAAKMSIKDISSLWCDPIPYLESSVIINEVFLKSPDPIIIVGGRGSGKTMFLRYWSYKVRLENTKEENFKKEFTKYGGTSVYIRIEGSTLKEFDGGLLNKDQWKSLFIHFFELSVGIRFVDFIVKLNNANPIKSIDKLVKKLNKILKPSIEFKSICDVNDFLEDKITFLDSFRTNLPFNDNPELSTVLYSSNQIIKAIPKLIKEHIEEFKDHIFFITIDEYENFSAFQQRIINTYIKFADEDLSYRISMRPGGFKTFDTVNEEDFIKEGNDYSQINFDRFNTKSRNKKYKEFLNDLCSKRINHVNPEISDNLLKIENYLGSSESLDSEIKNINVNKKSSKIFKKYLKKELSEVDAKLISNPDNLLMEMLNILWFNKIKKSYTALEINKGMTDFLNKNDSDLRKKYKLDYSDKYRYTLSLLVLSALKNKKSYYSFNTFSYISNNNPRFFINLCAETFQEAYFSRGNEFISELPISSSIQKEAAYINAKNELKEASKISKFGPHINRFILNLGNTFKNWQTDPKARYPETNQFSVDVSRLSPSIKAAFMASLQWSIIIEKENLQRVTPNSPLNQIYTLNKIFCPLFSISYRTRGGYNMQISTEQMANLFLENDFIIPIGSISKTKIETISNQTEINFKEEE